MARKTEEKDKITLDLINQVKLQKKDIERAERSSFATNMLFSYTENPQAGVNLNVESSVRNLICIAAFLKERQRAYAETAAEMGVIDPPAFTWMGFGVKEWTEDVRTRIGRIQIQAKKRKLEGLEERLNRIISPELRAEMELDAIQAELGGK